MTDVAVKRLPYAFAKRHQVLLADVDGTPVCQYVAPLNPTVLAEVQRLCETPLGVAAVDAECVGEALGRGARIAGDELELEPDEEEPAPPPARGSAARRWSPPGRGEQQAAVTGPVERRSRVGLAAGRDVAVTDDAIVADLRINPANSASNFGKCRVLCITERGVVGPLQLDTDREVIATLAATELRLPGMPGAPVEGHKQPHSV